MKKILIFILLIIPLAVSAQSRKAAKANNTVEEQIYKFNEFYHFLNAMYVDTLNDGMLIESAIKEVLQKLDPHSTYSSAEEMKDITESFEGSFSGIGVEFDILNDTLTVVNTIAGGPSESLGVLPNDKIVKIDGENVIGIARAKVPKLLRGPKGTIVEIDVIRRGTEGPVRFRITRDNIPMHTIDAAYKIDNNIGYIRVNRFAETTMTEFVEAFGKLGDVETIILDLRGNGGGLMDQAIKMSEFFLPAHSKIVSMEGRFIGDSSWTSAKKGAFTKGNVIVLMDAVSASASEIVAGAIQDHDRGLIIGQPSFGKGLVQRQVGLSDGSAVRITIARYHTPTGRVIQRPYEYGKTEDYYVDYLKRMYDAKYADSMKQNAPVYRTLKYGRKVIGGGGINPDIYIRIDTTKNYAYWNSLIRAGVVNEFTNKYLERERERLMKVYPSFEQFQNNFEVDQDMIDALIALGKEQKVEYDVQTAEQSISEMKIHVKALIARKIWNTNEYFRVVNSGDDPVFEKAVEVARDWRNYKGLLEGQAQ